MSTISSAEPEALAGYTRLAADLNSRLNAESKLLRAALERFSASCTEYNVGVDARLADELRDYAKRAGAVDRQVGVVGRGYRAADSGELRGAWAQSVGVAPTQLTAVAVSPALEGAAAAASGAANWLFGQVSVPGRSAPPRQTGIQQVASTITRASRSYHLDVQEWLTHASSAGQRVWQGFEQAGFLQGMLSGIRSVFGVMLDWIGSALEWIGKQLGNLVWGLIWGEPWFTDVSGAGAFAFIGDFVAGLIVLGDARDIAKGVHDWFTGEEPWWFSAGMIVISLIGVVPIFGDAFKSIAKPVLKWVSKPFLKKAAKEAEKAAKEAAEKAAEQFVDTIADNIQKQAMKTYIFEPAEKAAAEQKVKDEAQKAAEEAYVSAVAAGETRNKAENYAKYTANNVARSVAKAEAERAARESAERAIAEGNAFDPTKIDLQMRNQMAAFAAGKTGKNAKRLAGELEGLTEAAFLKKMQAEGIKPTPVQLSSSPSQTMLIYEYEDGTMVRYKPKGDKYRPGPTYSIEVKKDPLSPNTAPDSAAFKVDPSGRVVPRGPNDIQNPYPKATQGMQHAEYQEALMHAGHRSLK